MPASRPFFSHKPPLVFSAFHPNPDFGEILQGADLFRANTPDVIIALGGGSPIDVAKMIKAVVFTRDPFDVNKPDTVKPSGDGPPLVAISTTAGSGAETTQFAVFYLGENKQSLSHPSLRPDIAVVDPELTYSLPPAQTAATGFDALSQAIEAFWASSTTNEAQKLAETAIGYALPNLYNDVHTPQPTNRYNLSMAAYLAGQAINITRTTLPHALGYHLTKKYHLPHGHAVALTLPFCFLVNTDPTLPANMPGGREQVNETMNKLISLLGQESAEDCFAFWRNLMHHCGLASTFTEVGITSREQIDALIATINPERLKNHPVAITPDYLAEVFMKRL